MEPASRGRVRRFFAHPSLRPEPLVAGVVVAVVAAVFAGAILGVPNSLWGRDDAPPPNVDPVRSTTTTQSAVTGQVTTAPEREDTTERVAPSTVATQPVPSDMFPTVEFVGGCDRFVVYSQNRWPPPGVALRVDPFPWSQEIDTDPLVPGINGINVDTPIYVDGWVMTESPYRTTNPDPWNSAAWFHLEDDSGWVSFAGVRSQTAGPDATDGPAKGGQPVALRPECEGELRPVSR